MNQVYSIRILKTRLKASEERLERLQQDFKALSNQISYTNNEADRNRLKSQLAEIDREMTLVAQDCDQLKQTLSEHSTHEQSHLLSKGLQRLIEVLTPISSTIITKAYLDALPSEGRSREVPDSPIALVRTLAEIPGEDNQQKPLEQFVCILSQATLLTSQQRQSVIEWAQAQGFNLPPQPQSVTAETCLMIKVKPQAIGDPTSGYILHAVMTQDPDPLASKADVVKTPLTIQHPPNSKTAPAYSVEDLPHVLDELIDRCGGDYDIPLTDLTVQWFLPIELMSLPVEHWQIRIGRSQTCCNGQRCKAVLVRSCERHDRQLSRFYHKALGEWKKYWKRSLTDHNIPGKKRTLCFLDPATEKKDISWENPNIIGCAFIEHHDQKQQIDFWDRLLGQGLSIALWIRHQGTDRQKAKQMLKNVVRGLPNSVARHRQTTFSEMATAPEADRLKAAPLCLLWDNPHRPFPTLDYESS